MKGKRQHKSKWPASLFQLLLLALFFFFGLILGQVFISRVPDETGAELERYLADYLTLENFGISASAVLSAVVLYYRYPMLAFLLGFSSIGVVLLPVITVVFGFFLSFSVSCFTAAYGTSGILLAVAVSGLRCLVTLPVYFLLAIPAWETSFSLAALSFGRGRRTSPVRYGKKYWLRLAIAVTVLFFGMCVDLLISPWLLRWVLQKLLV